MDAMPNVLLLLFGGVVFAICLLRSHLLARQEAKLSAVCFLHLLTNRISSESKLGTITNVTIGDDLGRATLYGVGFFCEYVWPKSIANPLPDSDVNKSLLVPVLEGNIAFQADPNSKLWKHQFLRDSPMASLSFMITKNATHDEAGKLTHEMSMEISLRDAEKKEITKKIIFFNARTCSLFTLGSTFDDIIITVRRRVRRHPQRLRNGEVHG